MLVEAVTYYEDSYYLYAQSATEQDRLRNGVRLDEAERAFKERAAIYLLNLTTNELELGNSAFVGLPSDHSSWLADLNATEVSDNDAEARARRIFISHWLGVAIIRALAFGPLSFFISLFFLLLG